MTDKGPRRFVLVRGLGREAGHWHTFDRDLRESFASAIVERHDLPGNGELWHEPSPISTADMAADLRRRVWAQDRQPPILIGVSLGAMVCLDWLRRWPSDAVVGLVAINTSVGGISRPWERLRIVGLLDTLAALATRDPIARERAILALTTTGHASNDELARQHAAIYRARPIARRNVLRQSLAAARFRASSLATPTPILLLNSARDRMVAASCSRAIAAASHAQLAVHPRAGHDLTLDDPSWCVAQIAQWLTPSSRGCTLRT
ncbi:alpha/beta fold hydrolase [Enhygromyxa salina]|uniref:alpha/beta fold hydrolase n=1 Tax=Enhygromyxa salina TaxID=215803 RepID=UPI000D043CDE|nr:alpha/beta hydrolase [Enhygromyxa salina]